MPRTVDVGFHLRSSQPTRLKFRIPELSDLQKNQIISIVDKILSLTQSDNYLQNPAKQARVKEYERQIDQFVYDLYNLTPEEIAIVQALNKPVFPRDLLFQTL